jgi:hypothetical protein
MCLSTGYIEIRSDSYRLMERAMVIATSGQVGAGDEAGCHDSSAQLREHETS